MNFGILNCGYCNANKPGLEVTEVPRRGSKLREIWGHVLGAEFENYCNRRAITHICLTHFKDAQNGRIPHNAIPTPLPYCNEHVMKPVNRVEGNVNPIIPLTVCLNCGILRKNKDPAPTSTLISCFCYRCYWSPILSEPVNAQDMVHNEEQAKNTDDYDVEIIEPRR